MRLEGETKIDVNQTGIRAWSSCNIRAQRNFILCTIMFFSHRPSFVLKSWQKSSPCAKVFWSRQFCWNLSLTLLLHPSPWKSGSVSFRRISPTSAFLIPFLNVCYVLKRHWSFLDENLLRATKLGSVKCTFFDLLYWNSRKCRVYWLKIFTITIQCFSELLHQI